MVNALDSGLSSGGSSSPGQGQCVAFIGKTLTLIVPLFAQVYQWVREVDARGSPAMD